MLTTSVMAGVGTHALGKGMGLLGWRAPPPVANRRSAAVGQPAIRLPSPGARGKRVQRRAAFGGVDGFAGEQRKSVTVRPPGHRSTGENNCASASGYSIRLREGQQTRQGGLINRAKRHLREATHTIKSQICARLQRYSGRFIATGSAGPVHFRARGGVRGENRRELARSAQKAPDALGQLFAGHGVFVEGETERRLVEIHLRQVIAGLLGVERNAAAVAAS